MGNPIESRDVPLLGQLFWRDHGTKRVDLILPLRLFPSDQKHSTRNCINFAGVIFLVLNVDSRGILLKIESVRHRIKEFDTNEVEFREITLKLRPLEVSDVCIFSCFFMIFRKTPLTSGSRNFWNFWSSRISKYTGHF